MKKRVIQENQMNNLIFSKINQDPDQDRDQKKLKGTILKDFLDLQI